MDYFFLKSALRLIQQAKISEIMDIIASHGYANALKSTDLNKSSNVTPVTTTDPRMESIVSMLEDLMEKAFQVRIPNIQRRPNDFQNMESSFHRGY